MFIFIACDQTLSNDCYILFSYEEAENVAIYIPY